MVKVLAKIFQKISLIIGIAILLLFFIPLLLGIVPDIVLSGSMEPQIKTGSVVYVNSHVTLEKIAIGDVIKFTTKESSVIHRVISVDENGSFVTKGDSNQVEDGIRVNYDNLKGKVLFSIPYLGKVAYFLKSEQGIAVIILFVILNVLCIVFDKKIYSEKNIGGKDESKENKIS